MASKAQALVLHGPRDLRLVREADVFENEMREAQIDDKQEEREVDDPAADEVQVSIKATGLCGSDLHYYNHFRNGDILVREPLSLGHESAGIVTAIGSDVRDLAVDDHVALEVGVPCEHCRRCNEGRYNICESLRFRSSGKSFPHYQGTLQERINHPAKWCHKLPASLSMQMGALLEPLSVALHAYKRSQSPADAHVLVFGAGAVGLLCAAVAKMKGARSVMIADIDEGRLEFAVKTRFADRSFLVSVKGGGDTGEQLEIAKATAGRLSEAGRVDGYDVVFECTGVPSCVQTGIYASCPGGRLMLIGMGHPVQTLPLAAAALREVDIVGVFRYANTYAEGISLLQSARDKDGAPAFERLVSHRTQGFGEAVRAFDLASKTKDDDGKLVLKVMIEL